MPWNYVQRFCKGQAAQAKAKQELLELKQKGDLAWFDADIKLMSGQMEINKMEAMHGGNFKGGWRPAVGWICAFALAYKFIILPFIIAVVQIAAYALGAKELFPVEMLPIIDWSELSVVLLGMLGIGSMRSYDKRQVK